jgi:hypothetical protein
VPVTKHLAAFALDGVVASHLVAQSAVLLLESLPADHEHHGRGSQLAEAVPDPQELGGEPGFLRIITPAGSFKQTLCTRGQTGEVIQDVHPALLFPSQSVGSQHGTIPGRGGSVQRELQGRSVQIVCQVAACSCLPSSGHFSISTVVPLNTCPKFVVAPERHDHPGRFHVTFKMLKRQMFGRAGFALLRKRVLLAQ